MIKHIKVKGNKNNPDILVPFCQFQLDQNNYINVLGADTKKFGLTIQKPPGFKYKNLGLLNKLDEGLQEKVRAALVSVEWNFIQCANPSIIKTYRDKIIKPTQTTVLKRIKP